MKDTCHDRLLTCMTAFFFFTFFCTDFSRIQALEKIPDRDKPLYLVVFTIKLGDEADEGESHDGHQCELPGQSEHEDEVSCSLDAAAQEDVDVLGDEVAHLGGVS